MNMRILIPKGTEIIIIRPAKKKEDPPRYKHINIQKDFETEATELGRYHIFKYKCLENSVVLKNKAIIL